MTSAELGAHEARRELYEVMERDAGFDTKSREALELGERYLGVDNGHVTVIDPESDYWGAIASSDGDDGEYSVGTVLDLQQTFCRETVERGESLTLSDAPSQGWESDPAFEATGLHTYHGTAIELEDDLYGTVCFVDETPRDDPFADHETLFAELVARMLEYELSCVHYESELQERAELLDVVNRVLRHNLRNDLNLIRGKLRMLPDGDESPFDAEPVVETVEELIDLSNTARQLDSVVRREMAFAKADAVALVDAAARSVSGAYPAASVRIDGVDSATLMAKPTLETAFRELIENAAKHGGEEPDVSVTVTNADHGVEMRVSDGGDGLPEQERTVLTTGAETSLVHGSGLGLWMVHWIVTDHGGQVDATATDAGTTITVFLPRSPLPYS